MGRPLEDGSNREAINATDYILGPRAYSEARHSRNLIMSDAERTDGSYVAISSLEVARFFFCVSSLLSRHLFSSGWKDLIFEKQCNTEHLPDHVIVGLRRVAGLTQNSAPYLAYAVVDKLTKECLGSIHQSMQSTGRWHKPAFECRFPLDVPFEIEAEVIQIPAKTHHQFRYFVTRILSCKRPIPFKKCFYWPELHPEQGENFDDPNLIPMNLPNKNGGIDLQGFAFTIEISWSFLI